MGSTSRASSPRCGAPSPNLFGVRTGDLPNIVLTGFMGTGKSAVGHRIAELTGRDFFDTDAEIVASHGAIHEIFSSVGEAHFRQLERDVVARIAPNQNMVVATGGGTMLDSENVVAFMGSEIFTLTADVEEIIRRVTGDGVEARPLLRDSDDPAATITTLLNDRADVYNTFASVDTTGRSVDEVIEALRDAGASIASIDQIDAGGSSSRDSNDVALTAIIAVAVAVLVVLVVLVLTF